MYLIVGLGNPGIKYVDTRHNIGFEVVEQIFNNQSSISIQHSNFQFNNPLKSEIAKVDIGDENIILAKPQTYMNNSGLAVSKLITNYLPAIPPPRRDSFGRRGKLQITNNLIIVHDDISLEMGKIKISHSAGAGNHNGVQSIINHVNTKEFIRVRCGIGRGDGILSNVVLSTFTQDEKEIADQMVKKASEACLSIVNNGLERAMNEYN